MKTQPIKPTMMKLKKPMTLWMMCIRPKPMKSVMLPVVATVHSVTEPQVPEKCKLVAVESNNWPTDLPRGASMPTPISLGNEISSLS